MLRFYLRLVREIPGVFRGTFEAWAFWGVTVIAPLIVFLNPQLGQALQLGSFSRWYVFVPLALSFVYAMLRVNYERHMELQRKYESLLADPDHPLDITIEPEPYDFTGSEKQPFLHIRRVLVTNRSRTDDASLCFFVRVGDAEPMEVHGPIDVRAQRSYKALDLAVPVGTRHEVDRVFVVVRDLQSQKKKEVSCRPK